MGWALCSELCMHNLFESWVPAPRSEDMEAKRGDKLCLQPVRSGDQAQKLRAGRSPAGKRHLRLWLLQASFPGLACEEPGLGLVSFPHPATSPQGNCGHRCRERFLSTPGLKHSDRGCPPSSSPQLKGPSRGAIGAHLRQGWAGSGAGFRGSRGGIWYPRTAAPQTNHPTGKDAWGSRTPPSAVCHHLSPLPNLCWWPGYVANRLVLGGGGWWGGED